MNVQLVESILQKAYSIFIVENSPTFIFLYDKNQDAEKAYKLMIDYFGSASLSVFIAYNPDFLNLSIISESDFKIANVNEIQFYDPGHFECIKTIANILAAKDLSGRSYKKNPVVLTGVKTKGNGIKTFSGSSISCTLGAINKISTQLIPYNEEGKF